VHDLFFNMHYGQGFSYLGQKAPHSPVPETHNALQEMSHAALLRDELVVPGFLHESAV